MTKATQKKLEQIAMEEDYVIEVRGGLAVKGCDSEDFPEVGVGAIRRMLERAYELGRADAMKKAK